jgi:DMSO/TMAO reductase YedYZ molybdopterin-dependent catalytic subunit
MIIKAFALVTLLLLFVRFATAQTISIEGDVEKPLKMTISDIGKLTQVEVKGKDKDGQEHVFKGTPLFDVIQAAGIPSGNKSFLSYVQLTAADNYKVIFTLAEIDPVFTSQTILLATSVDGNPLPKGEGPFRVVAPNDKKHARWIREVTTINLVIVK